MEHLSYQWGNVPIGGGGYVTGITVHPSEKDLIFIRTDVGGVYRWNREGLRWIPLNETFGPELENFFGIESLAMDPSNPDVLYIAAGKYASSHPHDVLKSEDRGKTWKRTHLNLRMAGNEHLRWTGERLAVDPHDGNIVYFGSRYDGLWRSANGGLTWLPVNMFPEKGTEGEGIVFVQFDPGTYVPGEGTRIIYAGVSGKGIFMSENAGTDWVHINKRILHPRRAAVSSDGTLYVTSGNVYEPSPVRGVHKYANASWTEITPDGTYPEYCALAAHPSNPDELICAVRFDSFRCPVYHSTDGGKSWRQVTENMKRHCEIPWWPSSYFSACTSAIAFDAHEPGRIWLADWYGVWTTPDIQADPVCWHTRDQGHEEMVAFSMACPPKGAVLLTAIADNDGMRHTGLSGFPAEKYGNPPLQETTGVDFCEANPDRIARVGSWGWGKTGSGGYSLDNGISWTEFESWPYGGNGRIAVSAENPELMVVVPIADTPKSTCDLGRSWAESTGAPPSAVKSFWSWNQPLAADRVMGRTFYLYKDGTLFTSHDGGMVWRPANTSLPQNEWHIVKAAPKVPGEVWVALDGQGLYRSSDSGSSFTKVPDVQRAYLFAFGKALEGKNFPAIYIYGTVCGTQGIFRSDDEGENWVQINPEDFLAGCSPNCMEGDRQVHGRVYIGTNGRGYYFGEQVK